MPRPDSHPFPLGTTVVSAVATPTQDLVLVREFDTRKQNYVVPAYGDEHPDQKNYLGYKLSFVAPSEDGTTAKWFYVADRQNQENYNYAITYSQNDPEFPIVVRRY